MDADLDFRLLGPLEVLERGDALPLGGRRNRVLLALFLLSPNQVVSTDRLTEELWSGRPPETAGSAIRVHVANLRRTLRLATVGSSNRASLATRKPGYVLHVELDQIDGHRFERLVEGGRSAIVRSPRTAAATLSEALGMWRGPALADVRDEPFAREAVTRLEELRIEATEGRIDAELLSGRHAEVVSDLEALTLAHPLRERLAGQAMVALYRAGRQADALRAYSRLRSVLVEELGLEPSRELRALEQAILLQSRELDEGQWSTPPAAVRSAPAVPRVRLPGPLRQAAAAPITARAEELAALDDAWRGATGGEGTQGLRSVVVEGPAGIGKTRLVAELASRAYEAGAQVLFGRCDEVPLTPYQPLAEAVRCHVREAPEGALARWMGPWASELLRMVPEVGQLLPWLEPRDLHEPEGDRLRLFDAFEQLLRAVAAERPTLLVIEDLHWSDHGTALLLRYLARAAEPMKLLAVLTLRDEGPSPPFLANALTTLSREARGRVVRLEGLDAGGVALLMESHGRGEISARAARRLSEVTEGNPLFALELFEGLRESGELDRLERTLEPLPLPKTVSHVLLERMERLGDRTRRVLEQAAVIGRQFDLPLLARATGRRQEVLLRLLERATAAGVLVERPGSFDAYAFGHALIREALYGGLTASRRARLHGSIAKSIEASGATEDDLSALAYHLCASASPGLTAKAIEYACRAADHDTRLLAFEEAAVNLARAVAAARMESKPDAALVGGLLVAEGEARAKAGDGEGARQRLREAAAIGRRLDDTALLSAAALDFEATTWAGHGFIAQGRADEPETLILEALSRVPGDRPDQRAELLARLPRVTYFASGGEKHKEAAFSAVRLAAEAGAPALSAAAQEGLRWATWGPDDVMLQAHVSAEIVRLGREAGDLSMEFRGHVWSFLSALDLGDMGKVDGEITMMAELGERLGDPLSRWYPASCRAMSALLAGNFELAESGALEALEIAQRLELQWAVANFGIQLFVMRRDQGRLAELESTLASMAQEFPAIPAWRCALAEVLGATGRLGEARGHFEALSAEGFEDLPRDFGWLVALHELAEVCHCLADAARAATLYELLAPYAGRNLVYGPGIACGGSTSRNLGVLAGMLGDWQAAEAHFRSAVELNSRIGAVPWLARTECDHAEMLAARARPRDRRRVRELAAQAVERADRMGLVPVSERGRALLSSSS